jgi:hypothetical protein
MVVVIGNFNKEDIGQVIYQIKEIVKKNIKLVSTILMMTLKV